MSEYRRVVICVSILLGLIHATAFGQVEPRAVRVVIWQPHAGSEAAFEEGYKRHLTWHRQHRDEWSWHAWTIISGERFGYFVDGTFFRHWQDFDHPVEPAADMADNIANVLPYGAVKSICTYELVPIASNFSPAALESPLLNLTYLQVRPEGRSALEHHASALGKTPGLAYALLRPVDGTADYLLLTALKKSSEIPFAEQLLCRLAAVAKTEAQVPIIDAVRTESARYRPDLTYRPEK